MKLTIGWLAFGLQNDIKQFLLVAATTLSIVIPQITQAGWIRMYGGAYRDWGNCVRETRDGGYIVTGFTASFGSGNIEDIWLIKTDAEGEILWTKTFGGGGREFGYCVQPTVDGGYIITGITESFDGAWLIKTDAQGDTAWTRVYDLATGNWVQQTTDNGYIITGCRRAQPGVPWDVWLLKVDADGNTQWSRRYGGEMWDEGYCVEQTEDKGYIITGMTDSYGAGSADIWLLKTDSIGDTLWTRMYGYNAFEWSYSLWITSDSGYAIIGCNTPEPGPGWQKNDVWLLKTDAQGDTQWTRSYGTRELIDQGISIQQTSDGGYIIAGIRDATGPGTARIWLIKTDAQGDTIWTKTFGATTGDNEGASVRQTSDGGYIITGHILDDLCLIKTDSLGNADISEEPDITTVKNRIILSSIGPRIVIRFENCPEGFHGSIFDILGRRVDELHFGKSQGKIIWGDNHQSGIYFLRLQTGEHKQSEKIILLN